ncbi:unnamed protein product [Auanema sp. JU1783]|nr:unnamed protein product [Auanema sp. JU1783]
MAASRGFSLQIEIRESSTEQPIAFKVDGERFDGGNRTLKFSVNTTYKINLIFKPAVEINSFNLGGSLLELDSTNSNYGQYTAVWNSSGVNCCKKGCRENINLILQGPDGVLKKQLQCKFYRKEDTHVSWGSKLNSMDWTCAIIDSSISVVDETFK